MSKKWKEIVDTAKEETRKELIEEIRDLSILSESEIELVAPNDLQKSYLRNILGIVKDTNISNETKLELLVAASGSELIVNLLERVVC